ncbi:hypothetical protein HNQ50_001916 [Silvimonas terrae]|uniref:T4 beta protein n=1 Tax=Silvimonas terrae TaxID=300266 RepID=A0A840RFV2_9NEIS|nr:beta family protein [Silvimonas terrae]MBB5191193.1 hypothetical protein [Silvimonas terrae]
MSISIDFNSKNYYPALRSRPAEILGYKNLKDSVKDKIIPTFTLGAWPRHQDLKEGLNNTLAAVGGRPFILDLSKEPLHQTDDLQKLLDPNDGFSLWKEFTANIENVIPVVQITSSSKMAQVIRQARAFESRGLGKLAFRLPFNPQIISFASAALASLDSADNALVIVDAGYIRDSMASSLIASVNTINEIRDGVEEATIAVISSSFPSSVTSFLTGGPSTGVIGILERDLHEQIGADAAIYGDYGSIHAKVYVTGGGRYTPRIDYPSPEDWCFERRPDTTSEGYIDAAQALLDKIPSIAKEDTWGAEMIRKAAAGSIDGMKTPSSWIAARVNMHIERQVNVYPATFADDFEDLI